MPRIPTPVYVIAALAMASGAVAALVRTQPVQGDAPAARGGGPVQAQPPPNVCRTPDGVEYSCSKP